MSETYLSPWTPQLSEQWILRFTQAGELDACYSVGFPEASYVCGVPHLLPLKLPLLAFPLPLLAFPLPLQVQPRHVT